MTQRQVTTSAALYFDRALLKAVPPMWLEKLVKLFADCGVAPILFNADSDEFEDCDGYAFSDGPGEMILWNTRFPLRGAQLIGAVQRGKLSGLDFDSPRQGARDRDDARVIVSVSATYGMFYVGMDRELVSSPTELLRRAYGMACDLPPIQYGIGYDMPLEQHPASFAAGHRPTPVSEVFEMIRHRREWDRRPKSADELWTEELMWHKRHLTGLFRDAYAANILSETHVEAAELKVRGLGRLLELGRSVLLWELSEQEIPAAQRILQESGLLANKDEQNSQNK